MWHMTTMPVKAQELKNNSSCVITIVWKLIVTSTSRPHELGKERYALYHKSQDKKYKINGLIIWETLTTDVVVNITHLIFINH